MTHNVLTSSPLRLNWCCLKLRCVNNITEVESSQEADPVAHEEAEPTPETPEGEQNITKMTVKQLQVLAKQRDIGIARTKDDFLRIIKEKNPSEDLALLKGKVLFDRVGELHVSRLRTKGDLVRLLQA